MMKKESYLMARILSFENYLISRHEQLQLYVTPYFSISIFSINKVLSNHLSRSIKTLLHYLLGMHLSLNDVSFNINNNKRRGMVFVDMN